MKAKKLPSGSWRCQVYDYTDENGKRHYKSFTCKDSSSKGKRICEKMASEWAADKERNIVPSEKKLEDAIGEYISNKDGVLSPATIRGYNAILHQLKESYGDFLEKNMFSLDNLTIQAFISEYAKNHSPKTTRNVYGLITASIYCFRDDVRFHVTLPQKRKADLYIPTDEDIKNLIDSIKGTELEIPVYLAAFGTMRRSEICALQVSDIDVYGTAHVCKAVVKDKNGEFKQKTTKTVSSDRYVQLPQFVVDIIREKGYITTYNPDTITHRFGRILEKLDIPHFRFHDLRHYSASIMHSLGIPDVYIMQRGGWSSDTVLKQVYRHAMSDRVKQMNQIANDHFLEIK